MKNMLRGGKRRLRTKEVQSHARHHADICCRSSCLCSEVRTLQAINPATMNIAPIQPSIGGDFCRTKSSATIENGIVKDRPTVATVGEVHFNATVHSASLSTLSNKPFVAMRAKAPEEIIAICSTPAKSKITTTGLKMTRPRHPIYPKKSMTVSLSDDGKKCAMEVVYKA